MVFILLIEKSGSLGLTTDITKANTAVTLKVETIERGSASSNIPKIRRSGGRN
jgi:hypothetical protein